MNVFSPTNNPNDVSDQTVTNTAFYPDFPVADYKAATRALDTITDQRVIEALKSAIIAVNDQLKSWSTNHIDMGRATLADIPADDIGGESKYLHLYRTAVYARTQANLITKYRNSDTKTAGGNDRADEFENTVDDYLAEMKTAISKLLGETRLRVWLD